MKNFDTFEEILYSHSNNKITPGTERIKKLLSRLDNPQNSFKSVHIVGTNGKGSTGAFISSVLSASGYKTCFYSSPHLENPGERLLIDGEILSADEWINAAEEVIKKIYPNDEKPSYFEILTACAFLLAREKNVEAGVIEAGMGGKFDATNVMNNTACSVIASISIDHTEYLGNTLESIASEKFAVVKENVPACFSGVDESLIDMFKNFCEKNHALPFIVSEQTQIENQKITLEGNTFDFYAPDLELKKIKTKLIGDYQIKNAALALSALSLIKKNSFTKITENSIREGMLKAKWQGRLEIISREPLIIFDGGHNFDGVMKLCESIRVLLPDVIKSGKIGVIYAAMRDKNYTGCLELLNKNLEPSFYASTVPEMPRALKPDELLNAAENFKWRNKPEGFENPLEAIKRAINDKNDVILVCGSLYFIGWLKKHVNKIKF